jgi:hypothetical protein
MGKLGLTDRQIDDLVALMDAFTDRTLLKMTPGDLFPDAAPGTPSTDAKRRYFPGWTHRLHSAFPGVVDGEP